jgi:hypothetical protein
MTTNRPSRWIWSLALLGALGLVAAACGDDDDATDGATDATDATENTASPATETSAGDTAASGDTVEIDWWHIQNNDPGLPDMTHVVEPGEIELLVGTASAALQPAGRIVVTGEEPIATTRVSTTPVAIEYP